MDPYLVILAGGISSRMRLAPADTQRVDPRLSAEAQEKPKSMILLGAQRRPFLDFLLHNARAACYRDVVVVVGEHDRTIWDHYGGADRGNEFHGLSISFAVQRIPGNRSKPLGTADALLQGLIAVPEWAGHQFTVCNSDNLYSTRALRAMLECRSTGAIADYDRASLKFPPERTSQFAVIRKDSAGRLIDIVEKPSAPEIALARDKDGRVGVSMNLFRLTYDIVKPLLEQVPLHPIRLEKELPEAVRMMVQSCPGSVIAVSMAEDVPDLTTQQDIAGVNEFLIREFTSPPFSHP